MRKSCRSCAKLILGAVMLGVVIGRAESDQFVKRAVVRTLPASELKFSAFTHELKVTFHRAIAFDSVSSPSAYRLFLVDQPLGSVRIDRVSNATGESAPGYVVLYGSFSADSLGLEVMFPGIGSQTVPVSSEDTPISSSGWLGSVVQYVRQHTRLSADVRQIAQMQGGLGIDYDVDMTVYRLPDILGSGFPARISVASAGKLGSDSAQTANTVEASVVGTALGRLKIGSYETMYYGFRVPVGFESTQNQFADSLRGTARLQAVASIPFVSSLVLWWCREIDHDESFLPPMVYAGYTQTFGVKSDGRFDAQAKASLPLGPEMSMEVDLRASYVNATWETYHEISTGITTSIMSKLLFKYAEGKLAPTFQYVRNYGLGFGISL